jgi:hypothetical protein
LIGPLHDVFSACPGRRAGGRPDRRQTLQIRAKMPCIEGRRRLKVGAYTGARHVPSMQPGRTGSLSPIPVTSAQMTVRGGYAAATARI